LRRKSIKNLKLKNRSELKRIDYTIYQIALERGESSAKKVFQVLEIWKNWQWILSYGENPKWGYDDYILHRDGWFMTLDGEMVDFQIKSSLRAARKHLKEYPVRVIVVRSEIIINELDKKMRQIFKDKLPEEVK